MFELLHLHEGGHHPRRLARVAVQHHFKQRDWNDLP
jgi:hypothetical protein